MPDAEMVPVPVQSAGEEIIVRYRWTLDELLKWVRWQERQQMSPLVRGVILLAMGFVASMGAVLLWHEPTSARGMCLLGGGVGYPLWGFVIQPWRRRRWITRHEDRDAEVEYRFAPEVIRTRVKHGTSELSWAAFTRVTQAPEGFQFCQADQCSIWLPRHVFASAEDFERLAQLAQLHARDFRRINR